LRDYLSLSGPARRERTRDRRGLPGADPGIDAAVRAALAWLGRAQDHSATGDGGIARHYSLLTGWGTSYPETTGYIIPTFLDAARDGYGDVFRTRAEKALHWLTSIQLPDGSFQGGTIDATPVVGVTFNTGQILFGLAAGVREFGEPVRAAMTAAADWLVATQDADGCWRKHPTPFAASGEKTYETHVAWALLEAARVAPGRRYAEAALSNIHWALQHQHANGWLGNCCLSDPSQPLTHTLGYALRGILEGYRYAPDPRHLDAARRMATGLLSAIRPDGFLPGRLDHLWRPRVPWSCLTGTVQVAHCWLQLYAIAGEERFRRAACAANAFVRRTVRLDGPPETRGGVKGAFPVEGQYGPYEYLNWASKFFIDANRLEHQLNGNAYAS